MIQFKANGKEYKKDGNISIHSFLVELNLPTGSVIVEYNREVLHKEFHEKTLIQNGDTLEIIRAYAGG